MKVALYIRVSKDEQHPENQRAALQRFCDSQGHEIIRDYCDHGRSGRSGIRPALRELLDDISRKEFKGIVIWKLDRIWRNLGDLITLREFLDKKNIKLMSATENIETESASGRLAYHIFGAMAEYESDRLSERTKIGLDRVRKEGKSLGRDIGAERKQRIIESYLETGVLRETARETGEAYSTVRYIVGLALQEKEKSTEDI